MDASGARLVDAGGVAGENEVTAHTRVDGVGAVRAECRHLEPVHHRGRHLFEDANQHPTCRAWPRTAVGRNRSGRDGRARMGVRRGGFDPDGDRVRVVMLFAELILGPPARGLLATSRFGVGSHCTQRLDRGA